MHTSPWKRSLQRLQQIILMPGSCGIFRTIHMKYSWCRGWGGGGGDEPSILLVSSHFLQTNSMKYFKQQLIDNAW